LFYNYTAVTVNVPPFATVILYFVPSGDLIIIPAAASFNSISPPATSSLEVGLSVPIPTFPVDPITNLGVSESVMSLI